MHSIMMDTKEMDKKETHGLMLSPDKAHLVFNHTNPNFNRGYQLIKTNTLSNFEEDGGINVTTV